MKSNGNAVVNKIYNPRNVKPPMPMDMDEADSVMERYIRQKYEKKSLVNGKPESPRGRNYASPRPLPTYNDREPSPPPAPPPKTKRFGFGLRSVSSTFHLHSSSHRMAPRQETSSYKKESPPRGSLTELSGDTMEEKVEALRDLGFMDEKRNATVLRGLNGNVDKAVEVLIRLGEGPKFSRSGTKSGNGPTSSPSTQSSSNPFDRLDEKERKKPTVGITINKPVPALPSGANTANSTPIKSTNPFDMPPQRAPTVPLDQSFQQMTLSNGPQQQQQLQQPQPLFPNHTGGFPSQLNNNYQASTQSLQTYAQNTPTAAMPHQQSNPFYQMQSGGYSQNSTPYATGAVQMQAPTQPHPTGTNPFFTTPHTSAQTISNQPTAQGYALGLNGVSPAPKIQSLQPMQTGFSAPSIANNTGSPFYTPSPQPQPQAQPQLQPQPQQQQPQQQQQQYQMPMQGSPFNPFGPMGGQTQPAMTMSPMAYPTQQQQQPPMQQQYMPQRMNKEGILSLYQFSQAPPTIHENQAQNHVQQQNVWPQSNQSQSLNTTPVPSIQPPRRSVTMPMLSGPSANGEYSSPSPQTAGTSRNPFTSSAGSGQY